MLLIIIVLLLGCFGVILNSKKIPIKNNLLAILLLVSLLFIHNYYNNLEQFQQADEATMLGIAGKSTINNLQSDQDNEIQNLEHQYEIIRNLYQKQMDRANTNDLHKIRIDSSCPVLTTQPGSPGGDYGDNAEALASNKGKFSKSELIDALRRIRLTINPSETG